MTADLHVDLMSGGEWLVRGTGDPARALAAIIEHPECYAIDDFAARSAWTGGEAWQIPAGDPLIGELADWCHAMLARARVGYYRKVHCLPGSHGDFEGWPWQLHYADGPARGAFQAAYFPVPL